MITRIEVDGFKSLKGFSLSFEKGLNILVGPNGSGKTNIVSFFEFLAHLIETDASEATSRVGGAGTVFRRVGKDYERIIRARIVGCIRIPEQLLRTVENKKPTAPVHCLYDYSFSLIFTESRDSVLFENQRLKFNRASDFIVQNEAHASAKWGVDLESRLETDGTVLVKTHSVDDSLMHLPFHPNRRRDVKDDKQPSIDQALGQLLTANNISMISVVSRYTPELWVLNGDLTGGQIYNIVPSKLKLPEDSAKPPGIARDGSGLAATLYALQRSKEPREFGPWQSYYPRHRESYSAQGMDQIKNYLKLVNQSVCDISVANDAYDNQLRVRFTVQSGDYTATLPMGMMSDGTLKWLAVVTAALTAQSVFCIEEPENYLHPQMQGQVITILREILFKEETNRFSIMTTHSETLLNRCRPEELILVSMNDGRTEAKRCSNAEEISEEIRRTGFGLGYYYVSDAIQND